MKLRKTFARQIASSIRDLESKNNPVAKYMAKLLKSGKLNILPFTKVTDEHAEMFVGDENSQENIHQHKKTILDTHYGGYCGDNTIYIKKDQSHDDFTNTLVHECVHHLCDGISKDNLMTLQEEFAARVIADQAMGVYFTRQRIEDHIEDMEYGNYFEEHAENEKLEAIDFEKTQSILEAFKLKF